MARADQFGRPARQRAQNPAAPGVPERTCRPARRAPRSGADGIELGVGGVKDARLKRRQPAGWQRLWPQSGTAGVRSGRTRCSAMNEPVASFSLPYAPGGKAHRKDGLTQLSSRYPSENSNARFVRGTIGSGFIAPIVLAANEIFSADSGPHSPVIPLSTASACALT